MLINLLVLFLVAPYVGAWIETYNGIDLPFQHLSHPMWVRGLKRLRVLLLAMTLKSHPMWVRGLKPVT